MVMFGKRAPLAMALVYYLYSHPIIDSNEITSAPGVNISTAHRLLQDFEIKNSYGKDGP
jgi:hypothetical protein